MIVREMAGANVYNGTWTRRAGTDIFDAVWNGSLRDVIQIEAVNGRRIVFFRQGNKGRYSGTLSADGSRVSAGTASWYAGGWSWSATVSGRPDEKRSAVVNEVFAGAGRGHGPTLWEKRGPTRCCSRRGPAGTLPGHGAEPCG